LRTLRCGHYIFEIGELDAYIIVLLEFYSYFKLDDLKIEHFNYNHSVLYTQFIMESFQVTYNATTVYCHGTISFVRHMLLSAKSCFHVCFDHLPLKSGVLIIPTKCSKCKTLSNRVVYKHDTFLLHNPSHCLSQWTTNIALLKDIIVNRRLYTVIYVTMISSQDLCWYTNVNRIIKARVPVMWTRNIEVHNQAPSFDFLLFLIQNAI
jgi:hypothetical protein